MATIEITVSGCDDHTTITQEVTPEELTFLTSIREKINKTSTYGCMPKMRINDSYGPNEDDLDTN